MIRILSNLPHDTHVPDLLPAYAIGSLDADELRYVEEHLLSCWICRNDLSSFQMAADELSLAAPAAIPSVDLKDRLMQRVQFARSKGWERVSPPMPARPFWERLMPTWGLASLFLIIALATCSFILWQRLSHLEFATALGMRAVPLSATDAALRATGFVVISADGDHGVLVVEGLIPLGESQQYQLWLIRDGERTSGAVFSTDEHSYAGTRIRAERSLLDYSAVDITIEPAGGSSWPTGKPVLGGMLSTP
jgi:anti-sigma-K factor RskA